MSDTNDSAAGALPLDDHGSSSKKPELSDPDTPKTAADLEKLFDVPVKVSAILGRSRMPVAELLKLEEGAVIELDRRVGEAIDIYVNDRLVARGEVVLVDNKLGVTMTEIIKTNN
jgi:flagellar motor switch protein FliN/FliY